MTKRVMSDTEIKHRKKVQGKISQTTSTLGLTGLATLGAATAAKKGGATYRTLQKVPKLNHITAPAEMHRKLKDTATNIGVVSGGVGGLGGYNFAAYTNAESRKKKPAMTTTQKAPMAKNLEVNEELCGTYGEEGIAKNWSPSASKFDPEGQRMKRSDAYPKMLAGVSAAAGAGAGYRGLQAVKANASAKQAKLKHAKSSDFKAAAGLARKKSGKLAVVSATAAGGALALNHKKKSESWSPYVSKGMGDWKTIDQRERTQTRQRKTMRAAGAGAGLGVAALTFGHSRGGTQTLKDLHTQARFTHAMGGKGKHIADTLYSRAKTEINHNPGGAGASIGGAGLLAGSAAVGGGAKAGHTYQQHKVNQRRRANYKRELKKSDEVSAFGIAH